jgi:hypothetical protein
MFFRDERQYAHSFGLALSVPLAVAWIHSEKAGQYDPRPDPDHKAWNVAMVYQLEFCHDKFPVFLAVSLPIHDKANPAEPDNEYDPTPMKHWDGPDWGDFMQQWTVAVGLKSIMF